MLTPLTLTTESTPITRWLDAEWEIAKDFPRYLFNLSARWFPLADYTNEKILMASIFPRSIYSPMFAPVEDLDSE